MAGKNEKVDLLSDIGSMVNSQKKENQMLRSKKAEEKVNESEPTVETSLEVKEQVVVDNPDVKTGRGAKGRPKVVQKVERKKILNVYFDQETQKTLGRIKLEHNFDMKDVAYIATCKFLDEYMEGNELSEKGVRFINKRLKELNGV